MALIEIVAEGRSLAEELAEIVSNLLGFELLTESALRQSATSELRALGLSPMSDPIRHQVLSEKEWPLVARWLIAKRGLERHVVIASTDPDCLGDLPQHLRVLVTGPAGIESKRKPADHDRDLSLDPAACTLNEMAAVILNAAQNRRLVESGFLPSHVEARIQFETRLILARHWKGPAIRPTQHKAFGHPSEEVFANLLNSYQVHWDYEPRSFPLRWDKDGKVLEAFTPDFYLPALDLYIELTTMKQAHVTKKNRKVRLLRAIYPHINIQVCYQKDFQNLVARHRFAAP